MEDDRLNSSMNKIRNTRSKDVFKFEDKSLWAPSQKTNKNGVDGGERTD